MNRVVPRFMERNAVLRGPRRVQEARVGTPATPISDMAAGCTKLSPGTVSERPKDHVSKTCVGETPPWVQIPPVPPEGCSRNSSNMFAKLSHVQRTSTQVEVLCRWRAKCDLGDLPCLGVAGELELTAQFLLPGLPL